MQIRLLTIIALVLCSAVAGAQQSISGRILTSDRVPVLGAYIIHLPSDQHTHSNESGNFSIDLAQIGDSLQIMHLGYQTKYVIIEDMEAIKVTLAPTNYLLDQIVVGQTRRDVNVISQIDLATNPVNSSQEILRKVPGLFIGQHAGGGKAEQIFLRGFDIDHGTDVNLTVDGLPVNMVSHAHGQGYADLHFVIPETIEKIDFGKGPYFADRGNFATAGYVDFRLKEKVDESAIGIEVGQFNTIRNSALISLMSTDHHNLYVAGEYLSSDGPFESPQDFRRLNVMAKYTYRFHNQDKISVMFSRFNSRWNASGQVPVRAVESGLITRFGAIDDTEGGFTDRTNVSLTYNKNISDKTLIKNQLYYSNYNFDLYSNFTFFLVDPVNSDQIRQQEGRNLFGFQTELNHALELGSYSSLIQAGMGIRNDFSRDNELARTRNRVETLEPLRRGNIDETNYFGYLNLEMEVGRLMINPGLRLDVLDFSYEDHLAPTFSVSSHTAARVSPKLNFVYNYSNTIQFFAKSGIGFHSNDSRIVIDQPDRGYLPAAYGADLGLFWKPHPRMIVNAAFWMLHSEQEFVYVGDAGVVEPSGRSRRRGFDFGVRYQIADWLLASTDINYADPRALDEPEGNHYIPLAPTFTAVGGLNLTREPWSAGLNYRYLADRAANEDNSINAPGYFVADANISYRWRMFQLGISLENIFDVEWNEAQFATESRLSFETESVEEIHFTPGTPRFFKASLKFLF